MNVFFLLHHGVLKESSSTKKLRTVFNGSSKLRPGVSLNDLLYTGPNLLPHLPDLICRWRPYRYVFSANIEKIHIKVHPKDSIYWTILWRNDQLFIILIFIIIFLSFGLICSPFIANRSVRQLAIDHAESHPLAAAVTKKETYVDDVCSGGHSLPESIEKIRQTYEMFALSGFPLRKWVTNHPKLLQMLPSQVLAAEPFALQDASCSTSILGLFQFLTDASFFYKRLKLEPLTIITKRTVLSRIITSSWDNIDTL